MSNNSLVAEFIFLFLTLALVAASKPGTPCTVETAEFDCSTDFSDLICNSTLLTCDCWEAQYFDYFDSRCYKKSGSYCTSRLDNCTPNSICVWNTCACACTDCSVSAAGKCSKSIGLNCSLDESECNRDEFLVCRPIDESSSGGTCQCNGTNVDDAIYDEMTRKCVLKIDADCEDEDWSQPCPSIGASCRDGKCLCYLPFRENNHGQCRVPIGQPCGDNEDCDEYNFLVCNSASGLCECDKSQGLVDNEKGICVRAGLDACGGLLEGNGGDFEFPLDGQDVVKGTLCLWIVKVSSGQGLSFTLNGIANGTFLVLYPEHDPSEIHLTPLRLTHGNVGDTIQIDGQTLIIILIQDGDKSNSGASFSWVSSSVVSASANLVTEVNYFDAKEGKIKWSKLGVREGITLGLNFPLGFQTEIAASTDFQSCELADPCQCTYFGLYEVLANTGDLQEVTRICGHSSNFDFVRLQPQLVAFIYTGNSTQNQPGNNHVQLSWHASV